MEKITTKLNNNFHAQSIKECLRVLDTNIDGLTSSEAKNRLEIFGLNTFPDGKRWWLLKLFLRQFNNPLTYILVGSVIISSFLRHTVDAVFILAVIVINTCVGAWQEYKAEKTLLFLKKAVEVKNRVLRGEKEAELDASLLVPGDIVILHSGDKVSADARIIEARGLEMNEAALTGESLAAIKDAQALLSENTPLADRKNMVFAGTLVEKGRARVVVTRTGIASELGRISELVRHTAESSTPLQQKLARFARTISVAILVLTLFVMIVGSIRGHSFTEMFVTSLALAVSAIPEGLLPAVAVILAVGMRRLLKQKALIKRLSATETLGSTTVICTDKTGTLTHGDMQVSHIATTSKEIFSDGKSFKEKLDANGIESHITVLKIALLSSSAYIENPEDELHAWRVRGKPTERALLLAGVHAGLEKSKLEKELPLISELFFDPKLKFSATLREKGAGQAVLYAIGAPEEIIGMSEFYDHDGAAQSLSKEKTLFLQEKNDAMAKKGLRILASAYRMIPNDFAKDKPVSSFLEKLVFTGFIALKDPVRKEVKGALNLTKEAGIRTVIVTGDHKYTAEAVAEEIGMKVDEQEMVVGEDIDALDDRELKEQVKKIQIFARVSPEHKIRIVRSLRENGEVVAMIGDGINDAPALKLADIGVAVGSGAEIAKEASDMVLLDGNFNTIVRAVEQGRIIFENIRKTIIFLLADDFSEIFIVLGTSLLGFPLPLLAVHILWINLIEDGFPAAALAFGQERHGVMKEKPRGLKEPLFSRMYLKWFAAIFLIGGVALFVTYWLVLSITGDINFTRTLIFTLTAIDSLMFVLIVSSLRRPIFRRDLFSNPYLIFSLVIGSLMIFASLYMPFLQKIFFTTPLSVSHWMVILGISAVELVLLEATKYWFLRKRTR